MCHTDVVRIDTYQEASDYATLPKEVIVSNDSATIALLNNTLSIRLPNDPNELQLIRDHLPFRYILYKSGPMSRHRPFNAYDRYDASDDLDGLFNQLTHVRTMNNGAKLYEMD